MQSRYFHFELGEEKVVLSLFSLASDNFLTKTLFLKIIFTVSISVDVEFNLGAVRSFTLLMEKKTLIH